MMRQFELVERVRSYDPETDEDGINRAYVYAMKMHGSQKRASGDPYFSHPIEVAGILTGYRLDSASIMTALLHDTIEDTEATYEEVEQLFGSEVANLVEGVTKLARISMNTVEAKQAENFRKFVLAMSEDIRVLMVKLADRLHNMRTLKYIKKPEKRRAVALETMEIYAPLAERIGMQEIKTELEDLAFAELHTDARTSILQRLRFLERQGGDLVGRIMDELDGTLRKHGIECWVSGREKTPYSIWRKMQVRGVEFEQLSDIMAFRIVTKSPDECYAALGVIHQQFQVVPGRFKDYISTPKRNDYQSIHTSVIGPEKHRIEIQIRSEGMHEVAEMGVAAHWKYKDDGGSKRIDPTLDGRHYRWLRALLDIVDHAQSPDEFLEHTKLEMFQDQVFCFTPKGDLISLPRGATPVDFAYAVHSELGDTCVGAKVNGRVMPLRTPLNNGDQVDVVTSKAQRPSPEWEKFVVTGKARTHIRRFVRQEELAQFTSLGKQILRKAFIDAGYELTTKGIKGVLDRFGVDDTVELHHRVGAGLVKAYDVVRAVYPGAADSDDTVIDFDRERVRLTQEDESIIAIKGLIPGVAVHLSECCHPLPGDRIVGLFQEGKGVDVHTIDCSTLEKADDDNAGRWLDLRWDPEKDSDSHLGRLHLTVANTPGSLGTLSTVIAKDHGNISNLRISARSQDFFEMVVDIEVRSVKHLTNIIAALRATPVINAVERA